MTDATINQAFTADEWRDLGWLLDLLDDWLLIAEPRTILELGLFLESRRSGATTPSVQRRLGEVRRAWRRARVQ